MSTGSFADGPAYAGTRTTTRIGPNGVLSQAQVSSFSSAVFATTGAAEADDAPDAEGAGRAAAVVEGAPTGTVEARGVVELLAEGARDGYVFGAGFPRQATIPVASRVNSKGTAWIGCFTWGGRIHPRGVSSQVRLA